MDATPKKSEHAVETSRKSVELGLIFHGYPDIRGQ
jgi:hypothetical protein